MTDLRVLGQAGVTVTAVRKVHFANSSSHAHAPTHLGPLDSTVSAVIPVAVVFVYRPGNANEELMPVDRVQRAMELVLDRYPHLTGRLHIDSTNGVRTFDRIGSGAELIVAQCNTSLPTENLTMRDVPDAANALLPPIVTSLDEFCSNPLLSIKHTRFACGGVALGVRLPHTVCDADGFFQFVRDLAEVYRTSELSSPPNIQPYPADLYTSSSQEDRKAALEFQPSMYTVEPLFEAPSAPAASPPPPVTGRSLRFSARQLAQLKEKYTPDSGWISTFDALTAHLYDRVVAARATAGLPPFTDILTSVNLRPAGRLGLPARYFPNALLAPFLTVSPDTPTALTVHALAECAKNRDEIEKIARWIAAQSDQRKIRFMFSGPGLMTSSWARFDIYDGATFNNAPALVVPPFTAISNIDGLAYYLPVPPNTPGGGLDVYVPFSEPVWELLERDPEWTRFLEL